MPVQFQDPVERRGGVLVAGERIRHGPHRCQVDVHPSPLSPRWGRAHGNPAAGGGMLAESWWYGPIHAALPPRARPSGFGRWVRAPRLSHSGEGSRRGVHLWVRRGLLVQDAWTQPLPLGLSSRAQEPRSRQVEDRAGLGLTAAPLSASSFVRVAFRSWSIVAGLQGREQVGQAGVGGRERRSRGAYPRGVRRDQPAASWDAHVVWEPEPPWSSHGPGVAILSAGRRLLP